MADKKFGVKQINLIGASGTPTLTSPNNLNINAANVAISTDISVGGRIVGTSTSNVIPFLYNTYSDLPSASTYHGAFAHVHESGKALYAHSSSWFEIVNKESNGTVGTGTEVYSVGSLAIPGGTGTSNRIELGNSQEFTFQYNTSTTKGIISAAANPIDIQATTIKLLPNAGENGVIVNQNGSVELYHDNFKKLETTGYGVTIFGTAQTQQLSVSGISTFNSNLILDNGSSDIRLQHNISGTEKSKLIFRSTGALDYYASNGMDFYATSGASPINRRLQLLTAGGVKVEYQSSTRLETTSDGVEVSGTLDVSGISTFSGNVSVGVDTSVGVVLTSPNGTKYRLMVENDGSLATVAI